MPCGIRPCGEGCGSEEPGKAGSENYWRDYDVDAAAFPKGARLLFQQSAAPTGWVRETNVAYNDAALRIVTGNVATGGADAFSAVFVAARASTSVNAGGSVQSFTLSEAQLASHT